MNKRKPRGTTSDKHARGTYRPDRHAGFTDIEAPPDLPQAPPWLTEAGHLAWLDLLPRIAAVTAAAEIDSLLVATLANLAGACAECWNGGAVPPAAYLAEMRRLCIMFRLGGYDSRVVLGGGLPTRAENPFLKFTRRGPGGTESRD